MPLSSQSLCHAPLHPQFYLLLLSLKLSWTLSPDMLVGKLRKVKLWFTAALLKYAAYNLHSFVIVLAVQSKQTDLIESKCKCSRSTTLHLPLHFTHTILWSCHSPCAMCVSLESICYSKYNHWKSCSADSFTTVYVYFVPSLSRRSFWSSAAERPRKGQI